MMRILSKLAHFILTPLAKLASTPEIFRLRAEVVYLRQSVDAFEAGVDARLTKPKHAHEAEIKQLELRLEEAKKRNEVLSLRLQALEWELRKLPSLHSPADALNNKIGLA